ncbi:flexible cuticle protein 12-like [Eupeodes corollae]|uniref:flexible cuticle protein 12-like n=1 Tax=Eupeodes corollae TaxID=290404 RepID=UPI00248F49FA|nr:flexible cuticle protein 12-like [Eupeodes corollae]
MKFVIVFAAFCATVVLAAPLDNGVQIVRYDNDNIGVDGYNFAYETSDGVSREESAKLDKVGTDGESISVRGSVTWTAPDGVQYSLQYIADENGFQPQGAHLPK